MRWIWRCAGFGRLLTSGGGSQTLLLRAPAMLSVSVVATEGASPLSSPSSPSRSMLAAATLEISSQPMSGAGGLLPSAVQVASLVHEEESTGLATSMRPSLGLKVHWKWTQLENCVFVGHTNTDTDSIASAVGAACLYNGVAARAGPINAESTFALERYGLEVPLPFLEVCKDKKVCLMDHNQKSQMTEGVDTKLIRGIIDHHAIQSGAVVTDIPIYVDIRPWGSACTIIAHCFIREARHPTKAVAGMLLCGILSDTLNLQSPTTTDTDRLVCAVLARVAEEGDPAGLAALLFKAKSSALDTMTAQQLCTGDRKKFKLGSGAILGLGVIETTDPSGVLKRKDELLEELVALRNEPLFSDTAEGASIIVTRAAAAAVAAAGDGGEGGGEEGGGPATVSYGGKVHQVEFRKGGRGGGGGGGGGESEPDPASDSASLTIAHVYHNPAFDDPELFGLVELSDGSQFVNPNVQAVEYNFGIIVDIVEMVSFMLLPGPCEAAAAVAAFGGEVVAGVMRLEGKVSRKLDFVPPLSELVESGWTPPAEAQQASEAMMSCVVFGPWYVAHDGTGCCQLMRQPSTSTPSSPNAGGKSLFVDGIFCEPGNFGGGRRVAGNAAKEID